jgi:hypothetical protein
MNLKTFFKKLNMPQPVNNAISVLPARQIRGTFFITIYYKEIWIAGYDFGVLMYLVGYSQGQGWAMDWSNCNKVQTVSTSCAKHRHF